MEGWNELGSACQAPTGYSGCGGLATFAGASALEKQKFAKALLRAFVRMNMGLA